MDAPTRPRRSVLYLLDDSRREPDGGPLVDGFRDQDALYLPVVPASQLPGPDLGALGDAPRGAGGPVGRPERLERVRVPNPNVDVVVAVFDLPNPWRRLLGSLTGRSGSRSGRLLRPCGRRLEWLLGSRGRRLGLPWSLAL